MQKTRGKHGMPSKKSITKNLAVVGLITLFVLTSAGAAFAQESKIIVSQNRFVVLDDPSGWVSSAGDQWNGESTTIRWYVLVLNSSGLAAPAGVSVTTYLKYPNGTVFYSATALTDSNGYANFSRNLNNLNQITTPGNVEGYWTINATATVDSQSTADGDKFIYNEYGCGKSGSGCHSSNWQSSGQAGPKNVNTEFGTGTKDSPYMMGWDAIHNQSKFGAGYPHGTGSQTIGYSECLTCHKSYNGTYIGASSRDNFQPQYAGGLHAGKTNAACTDCHAGFVPNGVYVNMPIKTCYDCHPEKNNNLTVQAYTQSSTQGYSYLPLNPANGNIRAHDSGDTVVCITCHDNGHNISKPYNATGTSNTYTEYQQCTACHQSYSQHNNSVSCTVCHSQDAHVIKVFAQNATYVTGITNPAKGNCTNCHQNATFLASLQSQPKAGYTGRNAPQIPVPLNHSTDPLNGSLWDGAQPSYWVNTSQLSACYYCHGDTKHNASALGNINTVKGMNSLNQNLTGSTWCANCHYGNAPNYTGSQFNPQPPEVLNKSGLVPAKSSDGTSFYNHSSVLSSSYADVTCKSCHNNNLSASATSLNFSHNVMVGSLGGPDCISCHNIGGITQHIVNNTAMDAGIHANINGNTVNGTGISSENKKCWACHQSNGQQPTGMGDRYGNPYKCYDCHNGTAPYSNVSNAPIVSNHFKSGLNIKAQGSAPDDSSSCIACHNTGEMKVIYTGDNAGTNFSLPSHYGMKRTDLTGLIQTAYCTYCHNSSTENVTFAVSDFNNTIVNHSARLETAQCADCHDTIKESLARLHNSTLIKPVSNDTLCKTCHGPGGSAPINGKVEHKNLYCTECHANGTGQLAGKDIHGIKYLTQSNTYSTSNSSAVNCVTCHQTTSADSSLVGFTPPKIMNPLHHSDNILNGTVWGNYWTPGTNTACTYCHSDTKHNATPLGRILQWNPNYMMYSPISSNTSCADCHYKGSSNYSITQNVFTSSGLPIPPEITNGSWNGNTNYYNHSLSAYDDQTCKSCHGSLLSSGANMSEFLHNVAQGKAGGPDCISCHNIGGIAGAGRLVNFSAMNDSSALHKNLNSGAVTSLSAENKKCWACHGNGSEPGSSHPSNYKTPFRCPDCHVSGAGNFTPNSILTVSQHYWNGTSIKTAAVSSCYDCHNRTEMMLGQNLDPDGAASVYGGANGGSNSTSHYGKKRSDYPAQGTNDYCYQCHNNASTTFPFIDAANKTIANHSTNYASSPNCADCHASQAGRIHNSTLYKPAFSLPNSTFCLNCHGTGGSATIKNKEQHNGTLDCTQCHLNNSRSIHPVQYLKQDGVSWDTTKTNAVNCTNCHQGTGLGGFAGAPKVPLPVNHSTDPYSGKKWGIYWDNTTGITACYYCHQNEIHKNNTALFGNVSTIKGSNIFNNPDLANSTWCANCHYGLAQEYKGNLLAVIPPEITNSSLVASDGTMFFNHSGLSNFNDSNCKNCHGRALSGYSETSLNLSHSVSEGGGDDCVGCHGTSYIGASPSVARTFVNISAFNESIHQNLNATPLATVNNLDCWSCHYVKDMNRQNIKKCGNCHRKPSQWHGNANITTNLSQLW